MIPNDLIERRKVIKYMIERILEEEPMLSQWENDFINSVSDQLSIKGNLTDKQCEILEKIHDKL